MLREEFVAWANSEARTLSAAVWQKLEEENKGFFQAYYMRLRVKHQIIEFNKLLVQLMRQKYPTGVTSEPATNGTHIPHIHQNSACYGSDHNTPPQLKPENIQHSVGSGLSNVFTNGGSSLHGMHTSMEMSAHPLPNILSSQSSSMGLMQGGMNGGIIKTEVGFSGGSSYMFGTENNNVMEAQLAIGELHLSALLSLHHNP